MFTLRKHLTIDDELTKAPNLTGRLDPEDRTAIGNRVYEGYIRDKASREPWERRMEAGMDLAMQIQKDKNFPWSGCSNVVFPLITIAALQFSARSYPNLITGEEVVKYRIVGERNQENRDRADRISKHMSWQVLEEDSCWEEQHDRLLINLGIVGTNFIKTYFSPKLKHNVSELVLARDLVMDYYAKSVETCGRKTHTIPMYPNEIYTAATSGVFADDTLTAEWYTARPAQPLPETSNKDMRAGLVQPPPEVDSAFQFLEQHCLLDLDGDGYAEPYIATVEFTSKCLVRLVARWETMDDVERNASGKIVQIRSMEYFTKYSFLPAPDGSIYDLGFGVLLGPLNESVDSGINQLLDSGTMQNSMGGFLGRGAKIRGGVYTMAPWEWKRVDSTGDDLRKNLVPFPERAPSDVMFKLIGLLINYADRIAGTVDQMVGENPGQNTPASTSQNMTEQGMKVYNAIFKRVWRSMKKEFEKLHRLNGLYLPAMISFGDKEHKIRREDYTTSSEQVCPVADPHVTSEQQRMLKAQAVRVAAHEVPGYDIPETERRFLKAMQVDDIDKVYPGPDKVPPLPNPKMQVEQLKVEIKKMELSEKRRQFMSELQISIKKTYAEIAVLRAQEAEILAGISNDRNELQLKAFEIAINALTEHNAMQNERMQTLSQMGESDGEGSDSGSGAGGVSPVAKSGTDG